MDFNVLIGLLSIMGMFVIYVTFYRTGEYKHDEDHKPKVKKGRKYDFSGQEMKLHQLYVKCNAFYETLDEKQKLQFIKRSIIFIHTSIFVPHQSLKMNADMVAQIAAAYVQLTFGMRKKLLRYFNYIHVYPERFYSNQTNQYHRGEVHLDGHIAISWKDFMYGFEIQMMGLTWGCMNFRMHLEWRF
jgi:Mlc titration factor MtfA (ptsG expression regulator)